MAAPLGLRLRDDTRVVAAVVAGGWGALAARGWLADRLADPVPALVALFLIVGLVGALWPLPLAARPLPLRRSLVALAAGLGAVAVARLLLGASRPTEAVSLVALAVVLNAVAAVAEEAFFRRLVFGLLQVRGTTVAIWGSALAFALGHVAVHGWGVLPLDLAIGLLLSWQRAASGSWLVPAVTHAVAAAWLLS